jgi:hypothetical protein
MKRGREKRENVKKRKEGKRLTLSSTAQVICDLAFLNAYSSKIS